MENEYSYFTFKIQKLTGIDLRLYKSQQMQRRIYSIMQRNGCGDLVHYYNLLEKDPSALQRFKDFITINVSEFFRNKEKFDELKAQVLPYLLRGKERLRIWSAGCSNGAEPYSLAIIMDELAPKMPVDIIGTDIDATVLQKAKNGVYTENDLKNVERPRLLKYFTADKMAGTYEVKPFIKFKVKFEIHNLLKDPFPEDIDLILCRNVVIYFTDEAKESLYKNFYRSLRPGGILFVGGTESILNAKAIGFASMASFFYQKPASII